MYDDTDKDKVQALVSVTSFDLAPSSKHPDIDAMDEDPALKIVKRALLDAWNEQRLGVARPGVKISDLMDRTQYGDSVVRTRLDSLVESGSALIIPGKGRRPAFYFPNLEDESLKKAFQQASQNIEQSNASVGKSASVNRQLDDASALKRLTGIREDLASEIEELSKVLEVKKLKLSSVDADIDAMRKSIEIKTKLESGYFEE